MTSRAGMMREGLSRWGIGWVLRTVAASAALVFAALSANAQTILVNPRPLTGQEITDYGLPGATQKSPGTPNSGIGQPIYLEVLAQKTNVNWVVTNVTWVLVAKPTGSALVLTNLPSGPLTTNVPAADVQALGNFAIPTNGRAMLVPDVVGSTVQGDYKVVTTVYYAHRSLAVTNTYFGATYKGMYSDEEALGCESCHPDKLASFSETQHSDAFTRKINGIGVTSFGTNCYSCHVLGFDKTVAANNGGFDDIALQTNWFYYSHNIPTNPITQNSTNWANMPFALQRKSNIQCESCHGAGSRHMIAGGQMTNYNVGRTITNVVGTTRAIGISLRASNCGQCHDAMGHHTKNYEWKQTGHAAGAYEGDRVDCAGCHTAGGYIDRVDMGMTYDGDPVRARATTYEGVSCVACHDPHGKGMSDYQLRSIPLSTTFSNGVTVTEGGYGHLCMSCHHDRRAFGATNQVNTSGSRGPGTSHGNVQGDALFGQNAIEYGQDMPSSRHGYVVEDTCVTCHMQEGPTTGAAKNKVGGHTWKIAYDDGTNEVHLTEACAECHGEQENFNFGGEDYDSDGVVEGVQSEVEGLMAALNAVYTNVCTNSVGVILSTNISVTAGLVTSTGDARFMNSQQVSLRRARYNWVFVKADGSRGVHNPKYITSILRASIDDLMGRVWSTNDVNRDVDHDGLRDAWEIANFGSIWAQAGNGDADHDGLSNAQEQAAGTNPNKADTDNDGVSDYAELVAGADPASSASTPSTNMVTFLPAMELAYIPPMNGATMRFEKVDSLISGTWTNVGSNFVSSSGNAAYQLVSPRDADQRFFRVKQLP